MAKKYLNIGNMVEKRDKETGEAILDENGKKQYYVLKSKNSKIVIDGIEVSNKYINVQRPMDKLDWKLANKKISKAEYDKEASRYAPGGDLNYIQFEITAVEEL